MGFIPEGTEMGNCRIFEAKDDEIRENSLFCQT